MASIVRHHNNMLPYESENRELEQYYDERQKRMLRTLSKAINLLLTERQKEVYIAVKLQGKKRYIVAKELGVNKSTVTRIYKSAEKKINRMVECFE